MKAHRGGLLPYSGADFEDAELDRVEVGRRPLGASHADMFDRVHKHIGGAVQEEAELVCRESMAGGPVGVQEGLVILDEPFRSSASTVDLLIQKPGRSVPNVRDHKTRVGLSLRNLGLVDDLARTAPAIGLIIEACKEPHRLFGLLRQGGCLLHQRCAERFELLVDRLSENER